MTSRMMIVVAVILSASAARLSVRAQETPRSVWDGVYTEEQAKRGDALYAQRCAHCHAPDLSGGEMAPALNSADFKYNWSGLSVNDLFDRIKISMPQDNPGSLSRQQTADILAFVFSKSGFPSGTKELDREAEILKQIKFEAIKP